MGARLNRAFLVGGKDTTLAALFADGFQNRIVCLGRPWSFLAPFMVLQYRLRTVDSAAINPNLRFHDLTNLSVVLRDIGFNSRSFRRLQSSCASMSFAAS
jgi:hypothetical protein